MMQTDIHTSAQACGKVFSMLEPRHAVAYHFFNEEGTRDGIRERMAVSDVEEAAFREFREKHGSK